MLWSPGKTKRRKETEEAGWTDEEKGNGEEIRDIVKEREDVYDLAAAKTQRSNLVL